MSTKISKVCICDVCKNEITYKNNLKFKFFIAEEEYDISLNIEKFEVYTHVNSVYEPMQWVNIEDICSNCLIKYLKIRRTKC